MKLSVIIPAHNEEECIVPTIINIVNTLNRENIDHEIIVVDDNSTDATRQKAISLEGKYSIKVVCRTPPRGFGRAVREGLRYVNGDAMAIMMGDLSEYPSDLVKCFRKIEEGYDCVFGSRFIKGSLVRGYPIYKLIINRIANNFIRLLFWIKPNDITNAFKVYKKKVIETIPLQAQYFNITVELPLKAIVRGFSYTQIPISWSGRKSGMSKLSVKEQGRKYLFTVLYVRLEKLLLKDEIM